MATPLSDELHAYHEHPGLDRAMGADHGPGNYWVEFTHSHAVFVYTEKEYSDEMPVYQKQTDVFHRHLNLNI